MMGGYPATVNVYKFKRDTDIKERLAKRELIGDIAEVAGTTEELGLRQENFLQHPADVYSVIWTAAGGFGDPLERDPGAGLARRRREPGGLAGSGRARSTAWW